MARIAITGTASFLGGRLLRRLVAARGPEAVLAVDIDAAADDAPRRPPPHGRPHPAGRRPAAGRAVSARRRWTTVVHAAFFTTRGATPPMRTSSSRSARCTSPRERRRRACEHLVLRSFTGRLRRARPEPELPDRGAQAARRTRGWRGCATRSRPRSTPSPSRGATPGWASRCCASRRCSGPGVHTFYTRLLSRRVVPVVLGYDPLVQLLHPEDALEAAMLALREAARRGWSTSCRGPRSRC